MLTCIVGPEMTCSTVRGLAQEYLDGELLPARRSMFEEHLARCEACREAVAAERALLSGIRDSLRAAPVPHWLSARIAAAIAAASTEARKD